MPKKHYNTAAAPQPIGPYSQAVAAGGFLFVSGQIPLDPATGEMVSGDIAAQAERVCQNLVAVLGEAKLGADSVVRTTIYLADMADFARVNEVYAGFFGAAPPARSTIQVAGLPKGARVEIDVIAAF